jgi:hypothetical protein
MGWLIAAVRREDGKVPDGCGPEKFLVDCGNGSGAILLSPTILNTILAARAFLQKTP